jgi:hypothetical protein
MAVTDIKDNGILNVDLLHYNKRGKKVSSAVLHATTGSPPT